MYFQKYGIDNVKDPIPILPWYQKWCCSKIFNNKKRTSPLSFRWARGNSLIVRVIRIAREFYFCHFAYLPVLKILQWSRLTCVTGESKKSPWASWSCYTEVLGVSTSRERWAGRGLSDHFIWRGQTRLYIELIYMCFKQDTGVFVLASALISTWRSCLLLLNTF